MMTRTFKPYRFFNRFVPLALLGGVTPELKDCGGWESPLKLPYARAIENTVQKTARTTTSTPGSACCLIAIALLTVLSLASGAHAKGGHGAPARCIGNGDPCDSGLIEISPCYGSDCGCSTTRCYQPTECGGRRHPGTAGY